MKFQNLFTRASLVFVALVAVSFFSIAPQLVSAATNITGGTPINAAIGSPAAIDDWQITSDSMDDISVHIFVNGNGVVGFNEQTGITFLNNVSSGSNIYFSGTLVNVNAALAAMYFTGNEIETATIEMTLVGAGEVYYPGNGHIYKIVNTGGAITPGDAKIAANASSIQGGTIFGYLATFTNEGETDYVSPRLDGDGWFGASDAAVEGDWKWIDGPENGTSFWSGLSAGNGGGPVGGEYSNWSNNEPNEDGAGEDCSQYYSLTGKWNDLPCTSGLETYVVEYGEPGNLPTVVTDSLAITVTGPTFTGDGAGTELDPYVITTCEQLQEMNNFLDADFALGNNIDCSGTTAWNINLDEFENGDSDEPLIPDPYTGVINNGYYGFNPIGRDDYIDNAGPGFTGTLDGQGYTISDLWIFRKATDYNGLIGYATNATIENITLENPRIVGRSETGGFLGYGSGVTLENLTNTSGMVRAYLAYYGGGIAGYLVNTSSATGLTVTNGTVHGSGNVIGGLVGYLNGSNVTNSTTSANVDGGEYIGGAFGEVYDAQIDNVDATGSVDSNDADDAYIAFFSKESRYAGGFAGSITDSTVENSTASGLVASEGDYTGGFVGRIQTSDIFDSSATGAVSGNESVGGFGGTIWESEITDSFATGIVQSVGGNVGGFAGQTYCGSVFLRVSASGNVIAGNGNAGGFTGFDGCEGPGSTFNQVSAHGNVTGNNVIGGFVGESYVSTFINAYSSGSVTGNDQVGSFAATLVSGDVTNAYARGLITLTAPGTLVGGFANDASNTVFTNSFWDGEAISREDACNTGACSGLTELTTAQAITQSTYTDATWDFDTIWEINSSNNRYPHFVWESFDNEQPELLTLSATDITQTSAILRGQVISGPFVQFGLGFAFAPISLDDAGDSLELIGPSDAYDEQTGEYIKDLGLYFEMEDGLTCGTTYYYSAIGFLDMFGDITAAENELSFTTLACGDAQPTPNPQPTTVVSTSGQGTPWRSVTANGGNGGGSNNGSSNATTPATCPADQILTQNMRAGARNGKYHPYTKAVVQEVKILQAHMNRLGFNSGKVDGILGRITDGAIKRMQTFLGTKADGMIGPITRGLINNSCGSAGLQKTL